MKSREDQLEKDFEEFVSQVTNLRNKMNRIKSYKEFDRFDITEAAKKTGRIRFLRQAAKELIDFVEFPEKIRDPGRPVKYPDSSQEKKLFAKYVKEGLSIRKIAEKTGISKDIINVKLKRYKIK